jgi:hypothetical protein
MKKIVVAFFLISTLFLEGKLCIDVKDSNFTNTSQEKRIESDDILLNFNTSRHRSIILTDYHIKEVIYYKNKYKIIIAWLIEPKCTIEDHTACYKFVEENICLFDYVLTFDENLLSKFPEKCLFFPALPGKFIEKRGISSSKNKICSFITSSKTYCLGHKFRHKCLEVYKKFFVDYKDGNTVIPSKDPFLDNYFFSVVVENNLDQNFYFSEKILECFEKGVIPIYAGPKGVEQFFCEEGIIRFNSLTELKEILKKITPELYFKKLNSVYKNFETSKQYNWDSFLERLYSVLRDLSL